MPAALVTGAAGGIGTSDRRAPARRRLRRPRGRPRATAGHLRRRPHDARRQRAAVEPRWTRSAGSTSSWPTPASSTSRPSRTSPRTRGTRSLALLLTSPFLLAKYAWDALARAEHGRFIAVASAHALVASPYKAAYVAAKHGVLGLVKTLALEGADAGITATAVCPGYVRTPLVEKQIPDQAETHGISEEEALEDVILAPHAIKRLIEPEEVAGVIAFLAGPGGAAFTGVPVTHGPGLERAIDLPDRLTELLEHAVRASDPEVALHDLAALRRELDAFERVQAWRALDGGSSYGAVARALGISRQAAHRRYRELAAATEPPPGAEPAPRCGSRPRPARPSSSPARRRPRSAPPGWAPSTCCSGSCAPATASRRPRCAAPASTLEGRAARRAQPTLADESRRRARGVTAYARRVFDEALRQAAADPPRDRVADLLRAALSDPAAAHPNAGGARRARRGRARAPQPRDVARGRHPLEHLGVGEREVAGGEVAAVLGLERRVVGAADLLRLPAAGVEAAARRRVGRRRHVARQHLALLGRRQPRVGDRHGRHQRAGVRHPRVRVELVGASPARRSGRGTSPPRGRTCGARPRGRGR